ncbi:uncharacterized protein [Rutidosis leptorrhynchoides]|uniref:uncharacterized protein n=1 Tax=Rutidosis leptorrhynchoides TaxID=125765 RepID=UPI003A98EED0
MIGLLTCDCLRCSFSEAVEIISKNLDSRFKEVIQVPKELGFFGLKPCHLKGGKMFESFVPLFNFIETFVIVSTSKLAGTVNWGTTMVVGVFVGLLYGGMKEASASVSKDTEVTLKLGSTPDKREQYRLMRDAMEKRFIRITRGSIVGSVRLGMFTAVFYGLQNILADKRGVHDVYNIVGAGSTTAATFGLIMPGSLAWRGRNVMLGSVLGATFCFPLG